MTSQAFPDPDLPIFSSPGKDFNGDLILAVHGMGDQFRNDFIQGVAHMVAHHFATEGKLENQATLLPLGAWDSGRETHVDDGAVYFHDAQHPTLALGGCAFAEIYWADVARTLETGDYRIEEVKHWARTVVERIGQRYGGRGGLAPRSLHLAAFVVEEIAESLAAIGILASLKKLGGFTRRSFDLTILRALGDIQQVGDYIRQRQKIRLRFLNRLSWLSKQYPKARIHIIAHSEGSPVALYSLLSALNQPYQDLILELQREWKDPASSQTRTTDSWFEQFCTKNNALENPRHDWALERWKTLCQPSTGDRSLEFNWVNRVESFTTLGSPIDKHLLLWPEMWKEFSSGPTWVKLPEDPNTGKPGKIRWRNYFDYADPVGYTLDTARAKLAGTDRNPANWACDAFEFGEEHDHGFRRSAISGKAHLDYFSDHKLFSCIVRDSIQGIGPSKNPGSNGWGYIGRVLPFLVVALISLIAVFCFHRGLLPDPGSLVSPAITHPHSVAIFGDPAQIAKDSKEFTWGVLGCTALLIGTTVLARIYRLSTSFWMRLLAILTFAGGAALYWRFPGYYSLEAAFRPISEILFKWWPGAEDLAPKNLCRSLFIGISLLIPLVTWAADSLAIRKRLRPIWGLRISIAAGAVILFLSLVLPRLMDDSGSNATSLIGGWIAFVLGWWIATLAFDLAFCWQRYINVERSWISLVREARATPRQPTVTTEAVP